MGRGEHIRNMDAKIPIQASIKVWLLLFCTVASAHVVYDGLDPSVTDSFDFGTSSLNWRDIYLSSDAFISTMTITGGSITDSSGSITFADANLTTTGLGSFGALTATGLGTFGSLVVDTNTLVVNVVGHLNEVGIGTATPSAAFNVEGAAIFNDLGDDVNFRIEGSSEAELFFIDAGLDQIGIGTEPNEQLEITGNFRLPDTTASVGAIFEDANTLIHTFGDTGNFFAGKNAGNLTNSGAEGNIGVGENALNSLVSGDNNTVIGDDAGTALTLGNDHTIIGSGAGAALTVSTGNTLIGRRAGNSLTGGADQNVAIGLNALLNETTTDQVVAIGYEALLVNSGGSSNVAVGARTLRANINGSQNTAIGKNALALVTLSNNTAVGKDALTAATTAQRNTAIGSLAGATITTGDEDTLLGYNAGGLLTEGSGVVFLGNQAGKNQTTNSDLLIIDNQDRGDIATEATDAMIYGVFNAAVGSQTLSLNATVAPDKLLLISDAPAAADATGTTGHITWDSEYIYVCITTDTWKRVAISTWTTDALLLETGDFLLLETGDKLLLDI